MAAENMATASQRQPGGFEIDPLLVAGASDLLAADRVRRDGLRAVCPAAEPVTATHGSARATAPNGTQQTGSQNQAEKDAFHRDQLLSEGRPAVPSVCLP